MALYLRALKLPLSYIPLSQNRGRHYVLLEGAYCAIFVFFVWQGYVHCGLLGAGGGILITAVIDFFLLLFYAFVADGYTLSLRHWLLAIAQISLGGVALYTSSASLWWGLICFVISGTLSLRIFNRRLFQH